MFEFFNTIVKIIGGGIVSFGMLLGGGSIPDIQDDISGDIQEIATTTEEVLVDDSSDGNDNVVERVVPISKITPATDLISSPVPILKPVEELRVSCELSRDEIELGGTVSMMTKVSFLSNTEYEVDWDKTYLRNIESHNKAYFTINSNRLDNISAKITRKSDDYSKTVVCPIVVIIDDEENNVYTYTDEEKRLMDYQDAILAIDKQILGLKQEYIEKKESLKGAGSIAGTTARIENNLTNELNSKIYNLELKKQELYLQYLSY